MQGGRFTQLPFPFCTLFSQNMATMRLVTFKIAGTGAFKTLGCTAISFDFWHLFFSNNFKYQETSLDFVKTQQGKMHGPAKSLSAQYR
jgi:hypothetical protein